MAIGGSLISPPAGRGRMSVRNADVAIVGGGLMGVWTAYFLAPTRHTGGGSRQGPRRCPGKRREFRQSAPPGTPPGAISAGASLPCALGDDRCADRRALRVCSDGTPVRRGRRRRARKARAVRQGRARRTGFRSSAFRETQLRQRWPWLGGELHSGTFSARDATANPRLVSPAVMRTAQRLGAGLHQNTRVVDARAEKDGFVLETSTGDSLELRASSSMRRARGRSRSRDASAKARRCLRPARRNS